MITASVKNIKFFLFAVFSYIKYGFYIFSILRKGQSEQYEIMMQSHRLEKGLINKAPKPNWGWEKAERLAILLNRNKTCFAYETGLGVLNKYLDNKALVPGEAKTAEKFRTEHSVDKSTTDGGAKCLSIENIQNFNLDEVESFFNSRHSVREFNDTPIDKVKLEKAIALAMRCPSACNRQPFNVYFVTKEQRLSKIGSEDNSAASLYVTGVIDAYSTAEMLDWIVSPTILAAYLTLCLHAYGIGSCIYRKELVYHNEYNEKVKAVCQIPNIEQIILELRIGNYSDEVTIAYSNRLKVNQILNYYEEI